MDDFVRARSEEQKKLRMHEIMQAADALFESESYHAVTLTTLAQALGWSRGNLYKYVTTKEEVFLELFLEKQDKFFARIKQLCGECENMTNEQFAHAFATALDENRDYLKYFGLLANILETNVALEPLISFKKRVMRGTDEIIGIIKRFCGISQMEAAELYNSIIFHACGLNNSCTENETIKKAMEIAGVPELKDILLPGTEKFILMCLKHYKNK